MNKKSTLILIVLVLTTISASAPDRLVRLTIVNKSGRKIELSLTGTNYDQFYYLHIPEGSRQSPLEQVFTLVPDSYTSSLYYYELWDPVYGNQCGTKGQTLDLTRNVKLTVLPCDLSPAKSDEAPAIVKFGAGGRKKGR
jgi:hypothetical protein